AGAAQSLCAAGEARLSCLRPRLGELRLEQFPVATDRDQFGGIAAAHRRPAGVLLRRPGHRLVDHLRGDADDLGAAARRLPLVPAAIRAELYARGNSLTR